METHTITITHTSSPSIVKFESNHFLTEHQSFEFNNIDEASNSQLARELFYLPFVKKIYISGNFIAIEKYNIVEWSTIENDLSEQIQDFLNTGKKAVDEDVATKKVAVTVYAESTPNPSAMKFVANKKLVDTIFEFKNIDDAKISPLATKLFHFPFVKEIFIDENYVSINKYDLAEWTDIANELREVIRNFIADGNMIVDTTAEKPKKEVAPEINLNIDNLDDISTEIVNVLNEYIKPAVASDGGNIMFQSYNEVTQEVSVILQGACSGCPSSTMTLKSGIEATLKEMIPGKISSVIALNG
jgi:Fe-S cluster biogenesis protein NfuA|tara:strand:+ start:308 stop:1210 length:903 start_codon:yes stop_codon:yes gene_type:complete